MSTEDHLPRPPPPEAFRQWFRSVAAAKLKVIYCQQHTDPTKLLVYFSPIHELGTKYTTTPIHYNGQKIIIALVDKKHLAEMLRQTKKTFSVLLWDEFRQDFKQYTGSKT
jgi:hypothetical protein